MYCETKSKFGRPKMIFNYHEVKNKLPNTHKYHYYYYHLQSIYHCCMYHIISFTYNTFLFETLSHYYTLHFS